MAADRYVVLSGIKKHLTSYDTHEDENSSGTRDYMTRPDRPTTQERSTAQIESIRYPSFPLPLRRPHLRTISRNTNRYGEGGEWSAVTNNDQVGSRDELRDIVDHAWIT